MAGASLAKKGRLAGRAELDERERQRAIPLETRVFDKVRGRISKARGRKIQIIGKGNSKPGEAKSKLFSSADRDYSRAYGRISPTRLRAAFSLRLAPRRPTRRRSPATPRHID